MKELFNIPVAADVNYYSLFYLISFSVAFLIIVIKSVRSGSDLTKISIVNAGVFLAFVFGCKLMPFIEFLANSGTADFGQIQLVQMGLGGVFLSFLVIIFSRKYFRVPGEFYAGVGFALLAGLCIQKPGCMLAGCCRGIPVDIGLFMTYDDAVSRLPLPLIEMVFYLIAVWILVKWKFRDPGSKYFLAVILFCIVQFISEFLRDDVYTLVFAARVACIKGVQWIYLGFAMIAGICLFINENGGIKKLKDTSVDAFIPSFLVLFTIALAFYIVHPFLFRLEIIAINMALLPAFALNAYQLFVRITLPGFRWTALLLTMLPLILMSQTFPTDTTYQKMYKTISVGGQGRSFSNHVTNTLDSDRCGPYYESEFESEFTLISFSFEMTKTKANVRESFNISSSVGNIKERNVDNNKQTEQLILNVSPYYQIDDIWLGFGIGASIGANYYAFPDANKSGNTYPSTGLGSSVFMPMGHLRLGPKKVFALEYNYNNHAPSAMPAYMSEFCLGSGFGARNGFYLKYGFIFGSISAEEGGSFVNAYIPINNQVVLQPTLGFGTLQSVFLINVGYRFGHKETQYLKPYLN